MIKLRKAKGVIKFYFYCVVHCLKQGGVKNALQLHYSKYKINTASVYSLLFSSSLNLLVKYIVSSILNDWVNKLQSASGFTLHNCNEGQDYN